MVLTYTGVLLTVGIILCLFYLVINYCYVRQNTVELNDVVEILPSNKNKNHVPDRDFYTGKRGRVFNMEKDKEFGVALNVSFNPLLFRSFTADEIKKVSN